MHVATRSGIDAAVMHGAKTAFFSPWAADM